MPMKRQQMALQSNVEMISVRRHLRYEVARPSRVHHVDAFVLEVVRRVAAVKAAPRAPRAALLHRAAPHHALLAPLHHHHRHIPDTLTADLQKEFLEYNQANIIIYTV